MQMNYHEMTMNEPRDSPARRQQYLVICTVMAAVFFHSVLQAGGLASININQDVFPGGNFVYKETKRDYAAAKSMQEAIAKEVGLRWSNETINKMYAVFLDDPNLMGGRRQRFACGLLNAEDKDESIQQSQEKLMETNVGRVPPTQEELEEDGAHKLWPKLEYKSIQLPSEKALVTQFPYTDGFVSAMVFAMRVIPALRKAAAEAGAQALTVVSTCNPKESMCTHYAPLESKAFLLGHEDTTTYLEALGPEKTVDLMAGANKLGRRLEKYFGFSKKAEEPKPVPNEEL